MNQSIPPQGTVAPSAGGQYPQPPQNQYCEPPAPRKPLYKKWWFWLIIVVIIVAIGGAAGSGGEAPEAAPVQDAVPSDSTASSDSAVESGGEGQIPSDYAISNESFVDNGYGSYSVTGTFANTSGKELSYVQISYRMLDADGAQIGTAWANTNNLPDGGIWKFDAMYFDADVAPTSFQLADVASF